MSLRRGSTLYPDAPAVHLDDARGIVSLVELLKGSDLLGERNSEPGVAHRAAERTVHGRFLAGKIYLTVFINWAAVMAEVLPPFYFDHKGT